MIGEIKGKYVVEYEITTLEHLAIGGTNQELRVGDTDRKIVKDANGRPFIPGSGIKGFLRSFIDRISNHLKNYKDGINVNHNNKDPEKEPVCDLNDIVNNHPNMPKEKMLNDVNICDICLLFGAKGYGSPLTVSDAVPKEEEIELHTNTHIRIDRGSDTTAKGALFFAEAVPRNNTFYGKIIFEKRTLPEGREKNIEQIFKILVNQINDKEIYLGGMKSRGYGACNIKIKNIFEYNLDDMLLDTLNEVEPIDPQDFLKIEVN